jgi:hypothetical protein
MTNGFQPYEPSIFDPDELARFRRQQLEAAQSPIRAQRTPTRLPNAPAPTPPKRTFTTPVERWRPLVEKYFPSESVDKALHVIFYETGGTGNPFITGDGGFSHGLFQIQDARRFEGRPTAAQLQAGSEDQAAEFQIRFAAETLGAASGNWTPWGEGVLYEGRPFGALGYHPFPDTGGTIDFNTSPIPSTGGRGFSAPIAPPKPDFDAIYERAVEEANQARAALDAIEAEAREAGRGFSTDELDQDAWAEAQRIVLERGRSLQRNLSDETVLARRYDEVETEYQRIREDQRLLRNAAQDAIGRRLRIATDASRDADVRAWTLNYAGLFVSEGNINSIEELDSMMRQAAALQGKQWNGFTTRDKELLSPIMDSYVQYIQPTPGGDVTDFTTQLITIPPSASRAIGGMSVTAIRSALTTLPTPSLPPGFTEEDLRNLYSSYNLADLDTQEAIDARGPRIEEIMNAWFDQEAAYNAYKAGTLAPELPKLNTDIFLPGVFALEMAEWWARHVSRPAASTVIIGLDDLLKPYRAIVPDININIPILLDIDTRIGPSTVGLRENIRRAEEEGQGWWAARSQGFEEWDTNAGFKLFAEIASDPTSYIGFGLAAKATSKVPLLGKAVNFVDLGIGGAIDKAIFAYPSFYSNALTAGRGFGSIIPRTFRQMADQAVWGQGGVNQSFRYNVVNFNGLRSLRGATAEQVRNTVGEAIRVAREAPGIAHLSPMGRFGKQLLQYTTKVVDNLEVTGWTQRLRQVPDPDDMVVMYAGHSSGGAKLIGREGLNPGSFLTENRQIAQTYADINTRMAISQRSPLRRLFPDEQTPVVLEFRVSRSELEEVADHVAETAFRTKERIVPTRGLLGDRLTRPSTVSNSVLQEVNHAIDLMLDHTRNGTLNVNEAADQVLRALGEPLNPGVHDEMVKILTEVVDEKVARIGALATGDNPNDIFRRILNETHDTSVFNYGSDLSGYSGLQGFVLGLTRRVDAVTSLNTMKWVHRNLVQGYARSYLLFLNYGPWNALETQFRAWLGGVGFIVRPGADMVQINYDRLGWVNAFPIDQIPGSRPRLEVAITASRDNTVVNQRGLFKHIKGIPGVNTIQSVAAFPAIYSTNIRAVYTQRRFLTELSTVASEDYGQILGLLNGVDDALRGTTLTKAIKEDVKSDILYAAIRGPQFVRDLRRGFTATQTQAAIRKVGAVLQKYPDIEAPFQDYITQQLFRGRWDDLDSVVDETWSSMQDHYVRRLEVASSQLKRFSEEYIDTLGTVTQPITFYRGVSSGARPGRRNYRATEGVGLYVTESAEDAAAYGRVVEIQATLPSRPLEVDADFGARQYFNALEDADEEVYQLLISPIEESDDVWLRVHKELAQEDLRRFETLLGSASLRVRGNYHKRLAEKLLAEGYDAVHITNGITDDFYVLLDDALYSPSAGASNNLAEMFNHINDMSITVSDVLSQTRSASTQRSRELTNSAARDVLHTKTAELMEEFSSVVDTDLTRAVDALIARARDFDNPTMVSAVENVRDRIRLVTETRRAEQAIFESFRTNRGRAPRGGDWDVINVERQEVWNRYFQREAQLTGQYFALTEGMSRSGVLLDAAAEGGLTAQHVGALFRANGDNLSTSLIETQTLMRKEKFTAMVLGKAEAIAQRAGRRAADVGFTKEAVEGVYDSLVRSMRMDPNNLRVLEPVRQNLEGLRHELSDVVASRSLQPSDITALNDVYEQVARGLDQLRIYRTGESSATRLDIQYAQMFREERGSIYLGGAEEPLDPEVAKLLNSNVEDELGAIEAGRRLVGMTDEDAERLGRFFDGQPGDQGFIEQIYLFAGGQGDLAGSTDLVPGIVVVERQSDHFEIRRIPQSRGLNLSVFESDLADSLLLYDISLTDREGLFEAASRALSQSAPRLRGQTISDIRSLQPGEIMNLDANGGTLRNVFGGPEAERQIQELALGESVEFGNYTVTRIPSAADQVAERYRVTPRDELLDLGASEEIAEGWDEAYAFVYSNLMLSSSERRTGIAIIRNLTDRWRVIRPVGRQGIGGSKDEIFHRVDDAINYVNDVLSMADVDPGRARQAEWMFSNRRYHSMTESQLEANVEELEQIMGRIQGDVDDFRQNVRSVPAGEIPEEFVPALEAEVTALFNRLQEARQFLDLRRGVESPQTDFLRSLLKNLESEKGSITLDGLFGLLEAAGKILRGEVGNVRLPAVSRQSLSWTEAVETAMERTRQAYTRDFTDYTNDNILDAVGKAIFPFWTYEAQRWPYLMRTTIRHPGMFTTWGKYQDYTEDGYVHIPGTDISLNPFRGSVLMGGFRSLYRDYPEHYENATFNGLAGAMEVAERVGFFPGSHVLIPFGLGAAASGSSLSDYIDLPPILSSPMNALSASGLPYAEAFREMIFPSKFRDYYIAQEVAKIAQQGQLTFTGVDLLQKRAQQLELTPEEQSVWDEAARKVAGYQILFEQTGLFKLDIEERREANKLAQEFITSVTGIPPDQQDAINDRLRGTNQRFSDLYPLDPLSQQQLLEMEKFKYWTGISSAIYPQSLQRANARIGEYWNSVTSIFDDARTVGFTDSAGNVKSLSSERLAEMWHRGEISSQDWQKAQSELTREAINRSQGLRASNYFKDVPITIEERKAYAEEHNLPVPVDHPGQELIRLYYELSPAVDPITGDVNFDRYFAEVEALIESMPPKYQEEFLTYIQREWSSPQKLYWNINKDYIRPYNNLFRAILQRYTPEEQQLIERYKDNEELRKTLDEGSPIEDLMVAFDDQVTLARRNYRLLSPDTDAWLFFWGRTNTLLTDAATNSFNSFQRQYRSPAGVQSSKGSIYR